ncbi:putative cardiolipin synthase [Paraburkholderia atlantica]|uniref:Putative cardiolipin synthase n=1 Tax=Paraburkholderia atlantica TaxID=2654982 RepID=A0A6I1Q0W2_PARAM|nr:phospholipase D family protein [Paraburkholderia atlantica]MBB5414526.1 putative cardiolipin synthase [Paraburkholderia atlantica]MBB5427153.1 putative cardiolipin synthase [Paraburkholderia atlantica]MPW07935.1 phospholipase D family protein [Paraburkholderia atlantica]NUY29038.1 phospholipase D family protein [Paraburkholderia atlantica]
MQAQTHHPSFPHRRWKGALCALLCASLLAGCARLPSLEDRKESHALSPAVAATTDLGRAVAPELAAHAGLAGIYPLADAHVAFAARMDLIRSAQRTLDIQYYIWRDDLTGTLLLEQIHEAADRGVRVRLLLDDLGIASALDPTLSALNSHPNIEVRLFNPFVVRNPKFLGFVTDFSRANRRMHNKSLTADATATILGGRNIGDEYFDATDGVVFADLDVLAIGPAAADVSRDFDRYWASASAYPVDKILPHESVDELATLEREAKAIEQDPAAAEYKEALRGPRVVQNLLDDKLPLDWAKTKMISDDPAKGLNDAPPEALISHQLREVMGQPTKSLDLVSPYFVPANTGTQYLSGLAAQGVDVRVLTNALEATDVAAVHSGYIRRRVELLQTGVHLYELRRVAGITQKKEQSPGPFGSSGSSLHAKTFIVDSQRVFVGSFNFDPRSAHLNTELGLVIDSPDLATRVDRKFLALLPTVAYAVHLDANGKLHWIETNDGVETRHDTEPNTTWYARLGVWMLSIMPIESLL